MATGVTSSLLPIAINHTQATIPPVITSTTKVAHQTIAASEYFSPNGVQAKSAGLPALSTPEKAPKSAFRKMALPRMEYANGDVYVGQMEEFKPHGHGTLTFASTNAFGYQTYVGVFYKGKFHGQGTFTFRPDQADGRQTYTGDVFEGQIHGYGKMTTVKGTYDGQWQNNQMHGEGTFVGVDGTRYSGAWENNKKHGKGTLFSPDIGFLVGTWVKGEKRGVFTITKISYRESHVTYDQDSLVGAFWQLFKIDNVVKGCPTHHLLLDPQERPKITLVNPYRTFPNGDRYKGSLSKGVPHGQGTVLYSETDPAGRKAYTGAIAGGYPEGLGTLIWNSGRSYSGSWKGKAFEGYGTLFTADGMCYKGMWKAGLKDGQGILLDGNDSYEGTWVANKKHGPFIERTLIKEECTTTFT